MLTEVDKEDISREVEREVYRSGLIPKKSRSQRLWMFLNSSFGLWFLSAVLVSGLTAGTATLLDWLHGKSEADARLVALNDELLIRYMRMRTADRFHNAEQFGLMLQRNEDHYIAIFLRGRLNTQDVSGSSFSTRDTADLYLEVERLSSDPHVMRLAQNVWKVAAHVDTIARVGYYKDDPVSRARHIASELSNIRKSAGDLIYALGFRGSFLLNDEQYEPTFPAAK